MSDHHGKPPARGRDGRRTAADLADILHPVDEERFLSTDWHRSFRFIGGADDRFADLFGWTDLNHLLKYHHPGPPEMRLVKNGERINVERVLTRRPGDRRGAHYAEIASQRLHRALREGATLVLSFVSDRHPGLDVLARAMERRLHARININLYAAWRSDHGFNRHWDDHDVFILQIDGRKQWEVYPDTAPHPLNELDRLGRKPKEPVWTGDLTPGDVLYIPRGWWHVAHPADEPCLHLTVGVAKETGLDFMRWLGSRLVDLEAFRREIPLVGGDAAVAARIDELKTELDAFWTGDLAGRYLRSRERAASRSVDAGLPEAATEARMPPADARLKLAVDRIVTVETVKGTDIPELALGGVRRRYPAWSRPILDALAGGARETAEELRARCAGARVDEAEKTKLLRAMITDGTVVVTDHR